MVTTTKQTHKIYIYICCESQRHTICVRLKLKHFIHKQIETFAEMEQKSLECHSQNRNVFYRQKLSIELITIIIVIIIVSYF